MCPLPRELLNHVSSLLELVAGKEKMKKVKAGIHFPTVPKIFMISLEGAELPSAHQQPQR